MKKLSITIITIVTLLSALFINIDNVSSNADTDIKYNSRAIYTCDYNSGKTIQSKNEYEHYKIASMVKIMTALITFENIENGTLSYQQQITISHNAASMGGSQMFLSEGDAYTVDDLLKGLIVVSGNDCSVQLAEIIAGSEDSFVKLMNTKAKQLKMDNTLFCNCTGLPSNSDQYSCACDVAKMYRELLQHKGYYNYASIWIEDFNHPDGHVTQLVNTNRLIRFYKGCDGGKTGYTDEAKYCLACTAKKDDTRIINVSIGADTSNDRFIDSSNALNYAFNNYMSKQVLSRDIAITDANVYRTIQTTIDIYPEKDLYIFINKNDLKTQLNIEYQINDKIIAPIKAGSIVGECKVIDKDGSEYKVNLIIKDDVKALNYLESIGKIIDRF